ncbi:hypothetical protein DM01DRAFT_1334689 [Hesseltinella vesiculosa]|uniref:Uncharacterized protein n=1 Tax=Hesseltinella vesiculosa TaxID=101127 RepID=A0A1X2GKZ0_9FUNG|nr:hypothetical protein DM01DRAFT_1334689 [Hesseltinella vesiculosa]
MISSAIYCAFFGYLCTLYNAQRHSHPHLYAHGDAVIASLSFFIAILVMAYLRLRYRRFFVPMLQGFTLPFFGLTRNFNSDTFNVMNTVSTVYPMMIGAGIGLFVNCCLWPETAAKASELALAKAIGSIMQVLTFVQQDVFTTTDGVITKDASITKHLIDLNKQLETDISMMRIARAEAKYEVVVAYYSPAWYKPLTMSLDTLSKHLFGLSLAVTHEAQTMRKSPHADDQGRAEKATSTALEQKSAPGNTKDMLYQRYEGLHRQQYSLSNDPDYDSRTTYRLQSMIQPPMMRLLTDCHGVLTGMQDIMITYHVIPCPDDHVIQTYPGCPEEWRDRLTQDVKALQATWLQVQANEYNKGDINEPHLVIHSLLFHLHSFASELARMTEHVDDLLNRRPHQAHSATTANEYTLPRARIFWPGGFLMHWIKKMWRRSHPTEKETTAAATSARAKPSAHSMDGEEDDDDDMDVPLEQVQTTSGMFEEPVFFQQKALLRVETKNARTRQQQQQQQQQQNSLRRQSTTPQPPVTLTGHTSNSLGKEEDPVYPAQQIPPQHGEQPTGQQDDHADDNDNEDTIYYQLAPSPLDNEDYDFEEAWVGGTPVALQHAPGKHAWNRWLRTVLLWFKQIETRYAIKFAVTMELLALMVWLPIDGVVDLYNSNHGQWALLSAMVVFNYTVGSTALVCGFRVIATIVGAVCGYVALVAGQASGAAYPYVVAILVCIFQVPMWYIMLKKSRIARIGFMSLLTMAVIVITGYINVMGESQFEPALKRTITAVIAIVVVMLIDQLLWPVWAREEMRKSLAALLLAMGIQFSKTMSMMCQPNQLSKPYQCTYDDCLVQSNVLQQQYQLVHQTMILAQDEPRITKGPFPLSTYRQLLTIVHRLLFWLDQMITAQAQVKQQTVRSILVTTKIDQRKQLSAAVHLFLFTLASALQTRTALPAALPTALPVNDSSRHGPKVNLKFYFFSSMSRYYPISIDEMLLHGRRSWPQFVI